MKSFIKLCLVIVFILIIIPFSAMPNTGTGSKGDTDNKEDSGSAAQGNVFNVLITDTNEVESVSEVDYIIGVVAAELPASFHSQAIKALAVTSYTYAYYIREQESKNKTESLGGADISDSPDTHQGYLNKKQMREKWGDNYDTYYKKIRECVLDVYPYIIAYEHEPILAVYHYISNGKTESAKNVWDKDYPYLQPVTSPGDKLAPDFKSTVEVSEADFKTKITNAKNTDLDGKAGSWVSKPEKTDSGTVAAIKIGSKSFTGKEIRDIFSLNSNCFDISYKDGIFTFSVTGCGHGVGMSQYGADYMARQGSTWEEIIKHYYKDIEILEVLA